MLAAGFRHDVGALDAAAAPHRPGDDDLSEISAADQLRPAGGVGVVVSQNIVRAAAWLLFALSGVGGVLFLLNAQFVGAVQLLVYVGGTLVLVVFGVMLTAQGPFVNLRVAAAEWAIAAAVGLLL